MLCPLTSAMMRSLTASHIAGGVDSGGVPGTACGTGHGTHHPSICNLHVSLHFATVLGMMPTCAHPAKRSCAAADTALRNGVTSSLDVSCDSRCRVCG